MKPVRLYVLATDQAQVILRSQQGMALVFTLIVLAVFSLYGLHITYLIKNETTGLRNYEQGLRAFYQAEANINQAIAEIRKNPLEPDFARLNNVRAVQRTGHDFHLASTVKVGAISKTVGVDIDVVGGRSSYKPGQAVRLLVSNWDNLATK